MLLVIVIVVLVCAILAVIQWSTKRSYEELEMLNMKIATLESNFDLMDANGCILKALYAVQDVAKHEEYNNQAISLLSNVEENMEKVISSPNFFEEKIQELQEKYERAGEIIRKGSNRSMEEVQEYAKLQKEAAGTHLYLIKCSTSFSFLYSIREFDSLPDKEAKKKLQEIWWEFGFDESIECPEEIDEAELYLIWAKQYFGENLEQSVFEKIESLRVKDDLTSKEKNNEWMELIRVLYGTETGLIISPVFFCF